MTRSTRVHVLRLRIGETELAVVSEPVSEGEHPKLSPAERDVLRRILRGESNVQIARERGSAVRTVANQVAAIFRKFRVNSRGELVARHGGSVFWDPTS